MTSKHGATDALKIADARLFIAAVGFFGLAGRALAVVIGFQVYRITHNPLSLGFLGLIEAIPALSLVLFGGHVADHYDRRKILLITRSASVLCAFILAALSWHGGQENLWGLYAVIFLVGIARGFADPANTAMESQVVPKHLTVSASSWISGTWLISSISGAAMIGFVFDTWGAVVSYLLIGLSFLLSWICTLVLSPKPQLMPETKEPMLKSIAAGWRFVWGHQALLGAMMLDLFAVMFGGAVALLPIFAEDILRVGAKGLGFLNAAPSVGALLIMLVTTRYKPARNAGRNLLWAVAGFGVSMIVFAFSKNFWLSMTALFFSGLFDGISMVIRRSMVRLLSPDHLRGRVASANWVFISASNELGAFESGMVAAWIGTVPCVALGGLATLGIVGLAAYLFPRLRSLKFEV